MSRFAVGAGTTSRDRSCAGGPFPVIPALALCACLLGACTLDESRPDLAIALPQRFDHAEAARAVPPLPPNWPQVFGLPELTRLASLTASGNFDVAAAAARIIQADAQTAVSSAALFPQASSSDTAGRSFTPATARSASTAAGTGRTIATNSYSLGLTASYELDLWGRNRLASLSALDNAVATRFDRDALVLSSVASVTNAYLSLLSAQDRLKIADDNLKDARFALEAIKGRLAVGTVTALEVAQQQSVVDQQLAAVPATPAAAAAGQDRYRAPDRPCAGKPCRSSGGSLACPEAAGRSRPGSRSQVIRRRPDVAEAESPRWPPPTPRCLSARAALFPHRHASRLRRRRREHGAAHAFRPRRAGFGSFGSRGSLRP